MFGKIRRLRQKTKPVDQSVSDILASQAPVMYQKSGRNDQVQIW